MSTTPQVASDTAPSRPRRVLVADDNADITLTLSIMLEMMGFEVHCAADGSQALDIAKSLRPDMLFLDIGMPGLDGWEVCRRVRMLHGDAPAIIAITGYGQDDDRARSLQAGFDAHFTKPVQQDALVKLIERLSKKGEPSDVIAPGRAVLWNAHDASSLSELLLDQSPFHGVAFIDVDGTIRGWNRGAGEITGFRASDVVGKSAAMLFTPDDRARGYADQALRIAHDAAIAEDERWLLRKDGARFWTSAQTLALRGANGEVTGYVMAFRDATHQRTRIKSLENQVQALRMQAGEKARLAVRPVVLQALIEETVRSWADAAANADVRMHMLLPDVPLEAEVDATRFQQMLANLVDNAIRFTPRGRAAWVVLTADHAQFALRVKDEGCGIAPALLPRIFDAFTQAPEAAATHDMGVGLGLTVVKQIATLHQGTVEVRSAGEGKGSEFIVRIPLHPVEGASAETVLV